MPGLAPIGDLIDIALVAVLLYGLILAVRGARAHLALAGIAILAVVYLLARQLGLALTATLFQAFFAVSVLVLVVVFQREIRQFFERVAVLGLRGGRAPVLASGPLETLVGVVRELAETRRGALIVLPGRDPVERHLAGGIALDGQLSWPLLVALFDPHSPGHDGAIVIEGERVRRFAAHLPLSTNFEQLCLRGTRHAAALGLAERTDALCIVVSEERGTVSIARRGALRELAQPAELARVLAEFAGELASPLVARRGIARRIAARWRELLAATAGSALLWALVVPGSQVAEVDVEAPVALGELPPGFELVGVDPPRVQVRVSGLRRQLFLLDRSAIRVELDGYLVELGRRSFEVSPADVRLPSGLTAVRVSPEKVRVSVTRAERPAS
jgi:uncharacterized protein (TIGR00159 family)